MNTKELKESIKEIKERKNALILGHYYLEDDLQEISDYVGDSLALSRQAQKCDKNIIVFCGVHFMAETAKILNPSCKVLLPDMGADCSLAQSCEAVAFEKFKKEHPDHIVISYINCSSKIKALSDIICTSGNAEKIVASLPENQKIIFAPDKNLGDYISRKTGRKMVLWDGVCKVHDKLRLEDVKKMRDKYPQAKVITHPECGRDVVEESDFVGSTKAMLDYIGYSGARQFVVATERGIKYEMQRLYPDYDFIMLPSNDKCGCANCDYMKLNTLEKLYNCLSKEAPEIIMEDSLMRQARVPIERMLDISRQLGLVK